MTITKWLVLPLFALALCTTGCSPNSSTTVIESEVQSDEQIASEDTAYDDQYNDSTDAYEQDSPDETGQ